MTIRDYLQRRGEPADARACPVCSSSDACYAHDNDDRHDGHYASGYWRCFSCGAKGDGIGYLMAIGFSFKEALQELSLAPLAESPKQRRRRIKEQRQRKALADDIRLSCLDLIVLRNAMTKRERRRWMKAGAVPSRLWRLPEYVRAEARAHEHFWALVRLRSRVFPTPALKRR